MDMSKIDFKDKAVQRVLLILLIGIAVAGVTYKYKIMPKTVEYKEKVKTAEEQSRRISTLKSVRGELDAINQRVAVLKHELDSLEALFPAKVLVSNLINDLTKYARNNNIATANLKPLGQKKLEYYSENKYELTLIGGYHNLGKFFEKISKMDLTIKVDNMSLKVNPGLPQQLKEYNIYVSDKYDDSIKSIMAKFTITTYTSL